VYLKPSLRGSTPISLHTFSSAPGLDSRMSLSVTTTDQKGSLPLTR
jgi:hypothetical protein